MGVKDTLSRLHVALAEKMTLDLKDENKRGPLLYREIAKFLKDNNIEADIGNNPFMGELAKRVPFDGNADRPTVNS